MEMCTQTYPQTHTKTNKTITIKSGQIGNKKKTSHDRE